MWEQKIFLMKVIIIKYNLFSYMCLVGSSLVKDLILIKDNLFCFSMSINHTLIPIQLLYAFYLEDCWGKVYELLKIGNTIWLIVIAYMIW